VSKPKPKPRPGESTPAELAFDELFGDHGNPADLGIPDWIPTGERVLDGIPHHLLFEEAYERALEDAQRRAGRRRAEQSQTAAQEDTERLLAFYEEYRRRHPDAGITEAARRFVGPPEVDRENRTRALLRRTRPYRK